VSARRLASPCLRRLEQQLVREGVVRAGRLRQEHAELHLRVGGALHGGLLQQQRRLLLEERRLLGP
jgi:hypothetical protein